VFYVPDSVTSHGCFLMTQSMQVGLFQLRFRARNESREQ